MTRLLVLSCLLVTITWAKPEGAVLSACDDSEMFPSGHGVPPPSDPSPYGVTTSADRYSAGGSVTVTLQGSESFKGFMILALPADDPEGSPIGSFSLQSQPSLIQPICSGKGATHTSEFSSADPLYDKLELKWSAPSELAGNIVFYATFVKTKEEFWVKLSSAPLWDGESSQPEEATASPTRPPIPVFIPITNTGCGGRKGCYGECQGNACDFLLTWRRDGDQVYFELFGTLTESQGYVALGLGKTPTMTDVSIIACTTDNQVQQYYAKGNNKPQYETTGPINKGAVEAFFNKSETNDFKTMSCRFSYDNPTAKGSLDKWKDLDEDVFVFVARGEYSPLYSLSQHDESPMIAPRPISFVSTDYVSMTGSKVNFLIKAHACIMVVAWVFCGSIGVMLARYYKPMWTDTKACGQKVWFSYHRALMLCAMILTIIGFVIILVYQKGKFVTPKDLPSKAHPILGLIAIICVLLNPILAAFRCNPESSARPFFNWFHWFFGTVAHIFAIVAIFLGLLMPHAVVPGWITYVLMGFTIIHVCIEFILEIHQCCMYDKNRDRQEEYMMDNKVGPHTEPKYAGRGFKCAMLVIYVIVASLATIALVTIIALWGSVNVGEVFQ